VVEDCYTNQGLTLNVHAVIAFKVGDDHESIAVPPPAASRATRPRWQPWSAESSAATCAASSAA